MRILLINNLFQPEPNHLKGLAFAQALQKQGHDITVLTGFPNYPGGRVYPGYSMRWTQHEVLEGINVVRVAMYPSHSNSAIARILNYVSLGLSMLLHVPFLGKRFDIAYVYFGPITLAWPALYLKWFTGAKAVFDVQDIWPQSVTDSGMLKNRWLARCVAAVTDCTYRRADRFITLSEGYKRSVQERGISADRIDVIYNWTDETPPDVGASSQVPALDPDRFNVVYAGNFGPLQSLSTVVTAARQLQERGSPVRIILVGNGVEFESIRNRVRDEAIDSVRVLARVPIGVARAMQQGADALLLHLLPSALTRIGIPQKLQSYMAAGRPIVAAVEGDAADLVSRAGCGVTVPPGRPDDLAEQMERLRQMPSEERKRMGDAGRAFYSANLAFEYGVSLVCKTLDKAKANA